MRSVFPSRLHPGLEETAECKCEAGRAGLCCILAHGSLFSCHCRSQIKCWAVQCMVCLTEGLGTRSLHQ